MLEQKFNGEDDFDRYSTLGRDNSFPAKMQFSIGIDELPVVLNENNPEGFDKLREEVNSYLEKDEHKKSVEEGHLTIIERARVGGMDVIAYVSGHGKAFLIGVGVAASVASGALAGLIIYQYHKDNQPKP